MHFMKLDYLKKWIAFMTLIALTKLKDHMTAVIYYNKSQVKACLKIEFRHV